MTTVFTAFSSLGLLAVSAWFTFERVTYSRHKGKRWLADILADLAADIRKSTGIQWAGQILPRHADRIRRWSGDQANLVRQHSSSFARASSRAMSTISTRNEEHANGEERTLPLSSALSEPAIVCTPHRLSEATSVRIDSPTSMIAPSHPSPILGPLEPTGGTETPPATTQRLSGKGRFASAVRSVIMLQNTSSSSPPLSLARNMSGLSALGTHDKARGTERRRDSTEPITTTKLSRIIMLSHSLKNMDIIEILPAHQALVRHLQFSPNGRWLATCSWDRTIALFKVGNTVCCVFEARLWAD